MSPFCFHSVPEIPLRFSTRGMYFICQQLNTCLLKWRICTDQERMKFLPQKMNLWKSVRRFLWFATSRCWKSLPLDGVGFSVCSELKGGSLRRTFGEIWLPDCVLEMSLFILLCGPDYRPIGIFFFINLKRSFKAWWEILWWLVLQLPQSLCSSYIFRLTLNICSDHP